MNFAKPLWQNRQLQPPREILDSLKILKLPYWSFEGMIREGQLIVNKELAPAIERIFHALLETRFPIQQMVPIVAFGWDDLSSMEANNTSAFNYRYIEGRDRISLHGYGRAIDINPRQNPIIKDGKAMPFGAEYRPGVPGTITADSVVVRLFREAGFQWGGDFQDFKDYHHFQKPL